MPINFQCPKCGRLVRAGSKYVGRTVKCPGCQQPIQVPQSSSEISGEKLAELPCPRCKSLLRLTRKLHGRRVRCNTCHTAIVVSANPWKLSIVESPRVKEPARTQRETGKPPRAAATPPPAGSTAQAVAASPPPLPEADDLEPIVLQPIGPENTPSPSAEPDGLEPIVLQPIDDQPKGRSATASFHTTPRNKRRILIAAFAGGGLLAVILIVAVGYSILFDGGLLRGVTAQKRGPKFTIVNRKTAKPRSPMRQPTPNSTEMISQMPIHSAIQKGESYEKIEQAIRNTHLLSPLNSIDEAGFTPLDLAVKRRDKALIEFLLDKGAWINGGLLSQQTPLHVAAAAGFQDMAEVLLAARGARINAVSGHITPLHAAVSNKRYEMAAFLLQKGADPNVEYYAKPRPLNAAAGMSDKKMVEILLAGGATADPKARSGDYVPPLFDAIESGNKEIVLLLIEKGANVNRQTNFAGRPLSRAVKCDHEEIVSILLSKGATVSAKALFAAKSPRVLDLLLSHGAENINKQQGNGNSLLHLAAAQDDPRLSKQLVTVLLVRGADPNIVENLGRKPRALAEAKGHTRVARLLADAEAGRRPSLDLLKALDTKRHDRSTPGLPLGMIIVTVAVLALSVLIGGTYFLVSVLRREKDHD